MENFVPPLFFSFLRQQLIGNFLLMTKVLQMYRLQNTANITRMTILTLLSLRNTEAGVVYSPLVIQV